MAGNTWCCVWRACEEEEGPTGRVLEQAIYRNLQANGEHLQIEDVFEVTERSTTTPATTTTTSRVATRNKTCCRPVCNRSTRPMVKTQDQHQTSGRALASHAHCSAWRHPRPTHQLPSETAATGKVLGDLPGGLTSRNGGGTHVKETLKRISQVLRVINGLKPSVQVLPAVLPCFV